jgi:hypothetical protein
LQARPGSVSTAGVVAPTKKTHVTSPQTRRPARSLGQAGGLGLDDPSYLHISRVATDSFFRPLRHRARLAPLIIAARAGSRLRRPAAWRRLGRFALFRTE